MFPWSFQWEGKGSKSLTTAAALPLQVTEEAHRCSDPQGDRAGGPEGEDPRQLLLCLSVKAQTAIRRPSLGVQ